jgi:hypothetical protein
LIPRLGRIEVGRPGGLLVGRFARGMTGQIGCGVAPNGGIEAACVVVGGPWARGFSGPTPPSPRTHTPPRRAPRPRRRRSRPAPSGAESTIWAGRRAAERPRLSDRAGRRSAIGLPAADRPGGAVRVVHGRTTPGVVDLADAPILVRSAAPCFGSDVEPAGDFDGDGLDDVLISAPQSCGSDGPVPDANAYVLRGGGPAGLSVTRASDRVVRIDGLRTREDWADPQLTVAAAGDRTGDGLDDVLLGDGRLAHLVPGRAGHAPISLVRLGTSGHRLRAPATIRAMTTLGDLDGDGVPELAIGLPGADFANRGAGTGTLLVSALPA